MTHTEALSNFVVETGFNDLPEDVVTMTKKSVLDTLGCGIAGFSLEKEGLASVLKLVKDLEGKKEATVLVDGAKTNFLQAAFANGSFIHSIDFDDTHQAALTHTSSVMVPAALALGEKLQVSGKELVLSIVVGFEAATKVGQSVMPGLARFWHSTALNGTIGAAALAGKLLKLDAEEMNLTFGMAADIASGTIACIEFGDITKSLHAGMAAMKGLLAASLVKNGATAPKDIFDYSKGYCNAYSDKPAPEKITKNLGNTFEITFNGIKGFPTILASHTAIQAVIKILHRERIRPEHIREISVKTYNLVESSFCNYDPTTLLGARLSVPFCIAIAVVDGEVNLQNFNEERVSDRTIRELMEKIKIKGDPYLNSLYPEKFPAEVMIVTEDGSSFSEVEYYPKGAYKNPLSEEEFQSKFFDLATVTFPERQAKEILDTVLRLEELSTTSELTELLIKS